MKRFGLIAVVATIIILAGGVYLFSRTSKPETVPSLSGYEYFWGNGCPHCENVDKFFQNWKDKDKLTLNKMEVWYNKTNAGIMLARGTACGIARSDMAVPLLVTPEGKCILGDVDIINHFNQIKFDE
jgi:hypothetical protein